MNAAPPPAVMVSGPPGLVRLAAPTIRWATSRGNRPAGPVTVAWTDFTRAAEWGPQAAASDGAWTPGTIWVSQTVTDWTFNREERLWAVGMTVLHETGHAVSGDSLRVGWPDRELAVEEGIVAAWTADLRPAWEARFTPGLAISADDVYARQAAWARVLSGRVCRCEWRSRGAVLVRRRLVKAGSVGRARLAASTGMGEVPPLDGPLGGVVPWPPPPPETPPDTKPG